MDNVMFSTLQNFSRKTDMLQKKKFPIMTYEWISSHSQAVNHALEANFGHVSSPVLR